MARQQLRLFTHSTADTVFKRNPRLSVSRATARHRHVFTICDRQFPLQNESKSV